MTTRNEKTMTPYDTEQVRTLCFHDIKVGDCFDLGQRSLSRAEMIEFASKYDPQPFHLSDEGVKDHPLFERMSASGWHTALILQERLGKFWGATRVQGLAGAGIEEIRWALPVYADEPLKLALAIERIAVSTTRPDRGRITMCSTVHKQDGSLATRVRMTGVFAVSPRSVETA